MTEKMFGRFEEYNDHEGERWNWWLQLDDNEDELTKFVVLLDEAEQSAGLVGLDLHYTVHEMDVETQSAVDKLVEYADVGYFDSHNKVTGVFVCPDSLGDDAEDLYKGGIRDYFTQEAV